MGENISPSVFDSDILLLAISLTVSPKAFNPSHKMMMNLGQESGHFLTDCNKNRQVLAVLVASLRHPPSDSLFFCTIASCSSSRGSCDHKK